MSEQRWKNLLIACALLAIVVAPMASHSTDCLDIYLQTGPDESSRVDLGTVGYFACLGGVHADTNVITPGSTIVQVLVVASPDRPASDGKIKFNDGPFEDFEWTPDAYTWTSPIFAIPDGTTSITASVTTTNTGPPISQSITYRTAGS